MCLATMSYVLQYVQYVLLFLVLVVKSDRFQISWSCTLLQTLSGYLVLKPVTFSLQ